MQVGYSKPNIVGHRVLMNEPKKSKIMAAKILVQVIHHDAAYEKCHNNKDKHITITQRCLGLGKLTVNFFFKSSQTKKCYKW